MGGYHRAETPDWNGDENTTSIPCSCKAKGKVVPVLN